MKIINMHKGLGAYLTILALGVSTLTFMGCEQLELDEDPAKSTLAVLPYTTQADLELGVTGIYAQLGRAANMTTFFVNGWSGDDITTHRASNKADFREYDQRAISGENARTSGNWAAVYRMIRAANTVLANSEGLVLPDQGLQDRLLGETYFLRGAMFFHLTRVHGRIPLPLTVDINPDISLSSQLEVYEQIESDLLTAEGLLPAIYPGVNPGAPRPNSGSVRAMLARLYLDWGGFPEKDASKYAQAASSAKQVIDNSTSHGFTLLDNFGDLWKLSNRFNNEAVWTIPYCKDCGLDNRKFGKLSLPGDFGGWQETFAEIRYFEDFPENERKDATYHTYFDLDADGNLTSDPDNAVVRVPWTEFKDQQNPMFKKVTGFISDNLWFEFRTDRNDFIMRYAEVLLIYAEASGRSGNISSDAWEALNMVRRRAEGLPINSPAPNVDVTSGDIAELSYTERKWEFAGEYLRYNDLVRMERVEQALSNRNPQTSIGTLFDENGVGTPTPLTVPSNAILGSLGTDNYFAPIPRREIEQNPNLGN